MVDLNEAVTAAKGEIVTIDMEESSRPIANVSTAISSGKRADRAQ